MTRLITSDLHLSDRPQDQYRFDLFPWIIEQTKNYKIDTLDILGDLTDEKDNHPATLVNRIVDELYKVSIHIKKIRVLKGNHDAYNLNHPFFEFLTEIPGLHFIKDIDCIDDSLYLPHTKDLSEWEKHKSYMKKAKYIFMHQTVQGAVSSNGYELPGLSLSIFKGTKARIYSGDVHPPQTVGKVTYVGSPYHVHFGDVFDPRVLYVADNGNETNLHFDCLMKWSLEIESIDELYNEKELQKGDQVKITMKLPKEDIVSWPNYRKDILKACEELKLDVHGVKLELDRKKKNRVRLANGQDQNRISRDPKKVLIGYCRKNEIPKNLKEVGKELLQ